ncbi:MAG TPA: NAD(P)/FAD-dependent oxidoreductase [Actinophytocola sp.]|uniref:flavin-containing monooxygenase n=1 Tax=Actinophytocola sp. TaxID=1872138 RepID=UPI002DB9D44F|nr:NAD(P)/FAD-dependent oxidoreductase [Actinophytocola sp.]HEU5470651.1 NAD(P)/FAD-dependent oxidoreductase [Actinophytocola sp.]
MTSSEPVIIVGAGQSGLAAARAVRDLGLRALVLEAGGEPVGSWPGYYDSLTAFSPARYSALSGVPFTGDPDHYPRRDEVVDYLRHYAAGLDVEIRTGIRVSAVRADGAGFLVHTAGGETIRGAGVVAASGSFGNPHLPELPRQEDFTGARLHVADYRSPQPYAGQRVVVVGAGNSAVQVAYELAQIATVTLATRRPVRFLPQRIRGRDVHYWLRATGFDRLPAAWSVRAARGVTPVLDTGIYRAALRAGQLDRQQMFTGFDGDHVRWPDGTAEKVDTVIFATGYRPDLGYLESLRALDAGALRHTGGVSTTHPGLAYVGLEFQRSFASNTLRGVHRDARHVIARLAAHLRATAATPAGRIRNVRAG